MGTAEGENCGHRGTKDHRESQHRGTGKWWASGNGKTVGIRKPVPPGSCSIGKLGNRWLRRATVPGNREYQGAGKSWTREKWEDQAPPAQGNREQCAAGNWGHWAATAPRSCSTGELGELDSCSTRELEAPDHHLAPGASCQARHRVWGPAAGHGGHGVGQERRGDQRVPSDRSSYREKHQDTPTTSPVPIPGVDFKMKTIEVDGIKVRIQIW